MTPTGTSRVELNDLRMRVDGPEWVVGRIDTGEFIAVPPVAVDALRLLGSGRTVEETRQSLIEDTGRDVDVAGFVANVAELGFVRSVDGTAVPQPPIPKVTWPGLRAEHVRWLLGWPVAAVIAAVALAAVVAAILEPRVLPHYRDLLWSERGSLVIAGNVVIAWLIVWAHECAHLATARALGVPGRISLGTRLHLLIAQSDVTGVWAHPRRSRITVYLAGPAVNLVVASAALLVRLVSDPGSLTARLAAATAILAALSMLPQFLVFMRTDVYFLVQDLCGCRNLYADGSAYVRWWGRRLTWRGGGEPDPALALPARERRSVRLYGVLLLAGTAAGLAVAVTVSLPVVVALGTTAAGDVVGDRSVAARVDGLVTLAVVTGFGALWCRAWWRRHGRTVRRWLRRRTARR